MRKIKTDKHLKEIRLVNFVVNSLLLTYPPFGGG